MEAVAVEAAKAGATTLASKSVGGFFSEVTGDEKIWPTMKVIIMAFVGVMLALFALAKYRHKK